MDVDAPRDPRKRELPPKRSILKKGGRKSTGKIFAFDEQNVLETFHPADKDYGHMKIDEPKTPYHDPENPVTSEMLNEDDIAQRLVDNAAPKVMQDFDSDDDLSPQEKVKKVSRSNFLLSTFNYCYFKAKFKNLRKDHYNMREAMQRAKQLMEEEDDE